MESLLIGSTFATPKAEYDARKEQIASMNPDVYAALYGDKPTQQVVDAIIFAAKSVGQVKSFSDLFKSDDSIATGLASLANAKPPSDEFFLATHIAIQYVVAPSANNPDVAAADYGLIPPAVRNGNITVSQQQRLILPEQAMERFAVADHYESVGDNNVAAGTAIVNAMKVVGNIGVFKLSNPKWIIPDRQLKVDLNFAAALPALAAIKVIIFGAKNIRV